MVRKMVLVDTSSRVLEIIEVCSDVLVDFLVVLARVVDVVAPSSPLERLSIIAVLVGETTLARTVNQAHRVGRSLILVDLIDLAVRRFKHGSDLGDLQCLREPGELVGGHDQVGAWSAVNMDKFVVEVALELACPSLQVKLIVASSFG